jgi:LysM repeat protein
MSPDNSTTNTKVCPTCGTRLSENATRCLVCGRTFNPVTAAGKVKGVQGPRMPELSISLPLALGLIVLLLAIGAGSIYFVLHSTGRVVQPTVTPTVTLTPTPLLSPTPSPSITPQPTFTPLPPISYKVKALDTCISIAYAYKIDTQSLISLNNLPPDCTGLVIGQTLLVPQPTPTPLPQATTTEDVSQSTDTACEKANYTVAANDTIMGIANAYKVSIASIKQYNGLPSDTVYAGQTLIIPLCERLPTAGPTPTATPPPLYPAPNLLLPADGAAYTASSDSVTLQWAGVGTLRQNEAYAVTCEDITEGNSRKLVEYVTDTKFIVPATFRANDTGPHIFRWSILPVRQTGTNKDGSAVWAPAGVVSIQRDFTWSGTGAAIPAVTPTP